MSEKHRIQIEEQFGDAALALLMDEYAEADGEKLWEDFQADPAEMPGKLDEICRQHIEKFSQNRSFRIRPTMRKIAKAASFALVFLSLTAALIMNVEALRIPFLNFWLQQKVRFSGILYSDEESPSTYSDESFLSVLLSCVPDEYTLYSSTDTSIPAYLFKDDTGHTLQVSIFPSKGNLTVDTEDSEITDMTINGYNAVFIQNDALRVLWVDPQRELTFDVWCNEMEEADFWRFVYSLAASIESRVAESIP